MPAFIIMGVGRPADMPTSNCQGDALPLELALLLESATISCARAFSVQKNIVKAKRRHLTNMFIIIAIEKWLYYVFLEKNVIFNTEKFNQVYGKVRP